jgi:hypothetical protein
MMPHVPSRRASQLRYDVPRRSSQRADRAAVSWRGGTGRGGWRRRRLGSRCVLMTLRCCIPLMRSCSPGGGHPRRRASPTPVRGSSAQAAWVSAAWQTGTAGCGVSAFDSQQHSNRPSPPARPRPCQFHGVQARETRASPPRPGFVERRGLARPELRETARRVSYLQCRGHGKEAHCSHPRNAVRDRRVALPVLGVCPPTARGRPHCGSCRTRRAG